MTEPLAPVAAPAWSTWQRVAFRYLCLHWLLYALPHPFVNLLGTSGWALARLQEAAAAPGGTTGAGTWCGSGRRRGRA